MEGFSILIPLCVIIGLCLWLSQRTWDNDVIRRAVERKGGTITQLERAWFAPGSFGERNDRIYRVRYRAQNGDEMETHCKVSAGYAYFLEDTVIETGKTPPRATEAADSLREENRRLREELERLQKERDGRATD